MQLAQVPNLKAGHVKKDFGLQVETKWLLKIHVTQLKWPNSVMIAVCGVRNAWLWRHSW